jgi:hypothetical protein
MAESSPIDARGLDAALLLFAKTFVFADKQGQIRKRLGTADRRLETLETLPRWIRTRTAPLEGVEQSPSGLRARFGDLLGIVIGADGAQRVTIVHALERGRDRLSLFVADNGNLAMITVAGSAPILCFRI